MTLSIRCSSLPLIRQCPAAAIEPAVGLKSSSDEARLGTAVHDAIGEAIVDGPMTSDVIERCAAAEGVDVADVAPLAWSAWRWWQKWQHLYPDPHVEEALTLLNAGFEVKLTGHPDVWSLADGVDGPEIRVVDWKTGYGAADAWDQVNGYALLALRNSEQHVQVYRAIVPLRQGEWEGSYLGIHALESWWAAILDKLVTPKLRDEYTPGPHCGHCPRNHECPGLASAVSRAITLAGVTTGWLDHDAPSLYSAAKLLKDMGGNLSELARGMVRNAGGKIEHDGRTLELVRQERRHIEASPEAFAIIERYVPRQLVDEATEISKTKIVKHARDQGRRGQKMAIEESLIGELDAAGCLSTTFVEKLEMRKSPQAVEAK